MRISDWSSDVCSSDLELPVRVVLEVAGCGGDEAVAFPQRQVAWRPAPRFADAVVAFEAIEESMRDEGIAAVVQRVPILRFDEAERVNQLVAQWHGLNRAASTARSEEHTSEIQSLMTNSYAVLCLPHKKTQ